VSSRRSGCLGRPDTPCACAPSQSRPPRRPTTRWSIPPGHSGRPARVLPRRGATGAQRGRRSTRPSPGPPDVSPAKREIQVCVIDSRRAVGLGGQPTSGRRPAFSWWHWSRRDGVASGAENGLGAVDASARAPSSEGNKPRPLQPGAPGCGNWSQPRRELAPNLVPQREPRGRSGVPCSLSAFPAVGDVYGAGIGWRLERPIDGCPSRPGAIGLRPAADTRVVRTSVPGEHQGVQQQAR